MKRTTQDSAVAVANGVADEAQKSKRNGHSPVSASGDSGDMGVILASLQTMREGDFSVRLPGSWTGLSGKIADTFNAIVAAISNFAVLTSLAIFWLAVRTTCWGVSTTATEPQAASTNMVPKTVTVRFTT